MFICRICEKEKGVDEFYKHPQMKNGIDTKCKECTKIKNRANRESKLEYYREYDRARANNTDRVAARKVYAKTENGKEAALRANRKYRKLNGIKYKAHGAVNNALRDGRLEMPNRCECCDSVCKPEAHHCDYTKPLDVMWLCGFCHKEWHRNNKPVVN